MNALDPGLESLPERVSLERTEGEYGQYNCPCPQGKVLRVLMLDFSKAFDKVDHSILLQKLANTSVPDCVTRWFTAFLCERRQRNKIGDYVSDWCTINAGVPQGTLFGPVGFVIHINDLQTCLPTFKYVDDSTLWEVCSANATDSVLQRAATEAVQWSNDNLMSVNCDKTKELLISFARSKPDIPPITINGKSVERVSTAKLLGVTFSSDLTWDAHIEDIHSKASQRLYFLRLLHRAGVHGKRSYCAHLPVTDQVAAGVCVPCLALRTLQVSG